MYNIFDLHNDFYLKLNNDTRREAYVNKNKDIANHLISAIWTSELDATQSFNIIADAQKFVNKNENLFLGVEDLHFLSKETLEKFMSFRPIYAGLTWNNSNCLAGGAHESGKLTAFGKQVIKNFEQRSICIDTAHLNEESFMDVAKISTKPILCSHTACFGVHSHPRNLKDYQIKMIVDSNGLFGLCLVSDFLNGTKHCEISNLVAHIDYFACKFGVNNLALGTDFYGTRHLPKGIHSYSNLINKLSIELSKLGYTEKALSKIFYENASNFFLNLNNLK